MVVVVKFRARCAEIAIDGLREARGDVVRRNRAAEGQMDVVKWRRVERKRKYMIVKWEEAMVIYLAREI